MVLETGHDSRNNSNVTGLERRGSAYKVALAIVADNAGDHSTQKIGLRPYINALLISLR